MVSSWISQLIALLGTYVSWLFTLEITENVSVGTSIMYFDIAVLLIIFIRRLAHAGGFQGKEKSNGRNSNND